MGKVLSDHGVVAVAGETQVLFLIGRGGLAQALYNPVLLCTAYGSYFSISGNPFLLVSFLLFWAESIISHLVPKLNQRNFCILNLLTGHPADNPKDCTPP